MKDRHWILTFTLIEYKSGGSNKNVLFANRIESLTIFHVRLLKPFDPKMKLSPIAVASLAVGGIAFLGTTNACKSKNFP